MSQLAAGETVHPDEFKDAVDRWSRLFIGYRQQDSRVSDNTDLLDEELHAEEKMSADEAVSERNIRSRQQVRSEQASTNWCCPRHGAGTNDLSLESSHKKARIENTRTTTTEWGGKSRSLNIGVMFAPRSTLFFEWDDYEVVACYMELPCPRQCSTLQRVTCGSPLQTSWRSNEHIGCSSHAVRIIVVIDNRRPTASERPQWMRARWAIASEQSWNSSSSEPAVVFSIDPFQDLRPRASYLRLQVLARITKCICHSGWTQQR
jgi:hypothetical protein